MLKFGDPPYLECSSKGDKRFSAFYARLEGKDGVIRSIEDHYQAAKVFEDGTTGLDWRTAKGRKPTNIKAVRRLYSRLWDVYIERNPDLLRDLQQASGLSDIFGQEGHACQAEELWRIRNEHIKEKEIENGN